MEAALDGNNDDLTEQDCAQIAAEERGINDNGEEDEDEEDDVEVGEAISSHAPSDQWNGGLSAPAVLRSAPPLIMETHLFEINDGVAWPLPPQDDLTCASYWKGHRQRMELYTSVGDSDASTQRDRLIKALQTSRDSPEASDAAPTEQAVHAAADELLHTLKHKANTKLHIDADTGLLTLVPLQDLPAGSELFLHYGREWWTERLLSSLLLSVPDTSMDQVRWIEHLFSHELTDRAELYPLLKPAIKKHRARGGGQKRRPRRDNGEVGGAPEDAEPNTRSPAVLYNTVTRQRATDTAALTFAIRRSCLDQSFLSRLLVGNAVTGEPPIFSPLTPDVEVPIRALRRALLQSLRREQSKSVASTDASSSSLLQGCPQALHHHENDNDDDVFSV